MARAPPPSGRDASHSAVAAEVACVGSSLSTFRCRAARLSPRRALALEKVLRLFMAVLPPPTHQVPTATRSLHLKGGEDLGPAAALDAPGYRHSTSSSGGANASAAAHILNRPREQREPHSATSITTNLSALPLRFADGSGNGVAGAWARVSVTTNKPLGHSCGRTKRASCARLLL